MLQSPPPPKQLENFHHPKRCVTAQQPSPAFYWWPVCSEKLKMLRSISPPGLQELKLDLRWGDPRGPMGPWGDGPWILWDDFYFFIKRIRSNMIVNYDVFFFVLLPFFFFRAISLLFYSLLPPIPWVR